MFGFHQMWHCTLWPNISTSVLSVLSTLFQKSCLEVHIQYCKTKFCCLLLFKEKRSSPENSSEQAILVQSFSNYTVININIEHANWGLQSQRRSFGNFCNASDHAQSDLWVNLLGHPLLGRLPADLNVFLLWIHFLTEEWWIPDCMEMSLYSFPDWCDATTTALR